jgi:hypothetical protein
MKSAVRRKLDMAVSVREFMRANPLADPRHQAVAARFEERLVTGEGLLVRQADGRLVAKAARAERRGKRREISDRCLRHLVSVAEQGRKVDPDRFGAFRIPPQDASHLAFLTAVRSMLTAARDGGEELATLGLGETLLADYEKLVAEFERLHATVLEARRSHVGATADLERVTAEIVELAGVLDGINRYRFAEQPELLAAWESARNVVNPSRAKAPPPPPEGGIPRAA